MKIVILGAGAIGGYLGAVWQASLASAGHNLALVGNPQLWAEVGSHLTVTGGPETTLPTATLPLRPAAEALPEADLILCAMKATALHRAVADLQAHAPASATIVSLMNGLAPSRDLQSALPDHSVLAGMVPFNVVWQRASTLQRASLGNLALTDHVQTRALALAVADSGAPIDLHADLAPLQHGKLLLNLINPINALSGLTLHDMLSQRAWRRIYAAAVREALSVYAASQTPWVKAGPFSPRVASQLLTLPDWLFNATILRIQKITPGSRTSMAADVLAGRPTEIAVLNEEICRLATSAGIPAPVNAALVRLVREAEGRPLASPMSASALASALGIDARRNTFA